MLSTFSHLNIHDQKNIEKMVTGLSMVNDLFFNQSNKLSFT